MKIEVLVSTMFQVNTRLYEQMNLKSDALIINQCDEENNIEMNYDNKYLLRIINTIERGISKSRNMAITNSNAEICVIADDDLVYNDNYVEIIKEAYKKYPEADVIAFNVPSVNLERPTSVLNKDKIGFLHSMKLSSFQLTFRNESMAKNNMRFNEFFGAGAKYNCGEENILLAKCLEKGMKIRYVGKEIARVNHKESTWYQGFDDKLFITKGAMFYEMNPRLSFFLILQFGLRKWKLYKNNITFIKALKYMLQELKNIKF